MTTHNSVFINNSKRFIECRTRLRDLWEQITTNRVETLHCNNVVENAITGEFNEKTRQQNSRGEIVKSINELYVVAEIANQKFCETIEQILESTGATSSKFLSAPLKGKKRALEKAKDDYECRPDGPGISWLFDICRGSIVCTNEEDLFNVIQAILQLGLETADSSEHRAVICRVIRFKNRFANPTPGGFRDANFNIQILLPSELFSLESGTIDTPLSYVSHVVELQIHLEQIKELGKHLHSHEIYEYFRTYFRGNTTVVNERLQSLEDILLPLGTISESEISIESVVKASMIVRNVNHLNTLKDLLIAISELDQAIVVTEAILQLEIEVNGENSIQALSMMDDLGILLSQSGQFQTSKLKHEQALNRREEILGRDHRDTLCSVNNLGAVLQQLGDIDAARQCYRRAYNGRKVALSPTHPDTLASLFNCLALRREFVVTTQVVDAADMDASHAQEDTKATETNPEQSNDDGDGDGLDMSVKDALPLFESALGSDHRITLACKYCIANDLSNSGDIAASQALHSEVLQGRERLFGLSHPDSLTSLHALTQLEFRSGNYANALEICKQELTAVEEVNGVDHPNTLRVVNTLGTIYLELGQCEPARTVLTRAVQGFEKIFGEDNIATLESVNNLALVHRELKEFETAKVLFNRCLNAFKATKGANHPQTLSVLDNLGNVLKDVGEFAEAKRTLLLSLAGREVECGPDSPTTLGSVLNLGELLRDMGEFDEAKILAQRALTGFARFFGESHPYTLCAMGSLGKIQSDLRNDGEAELLLKQALDGFLLCLGADHSFTIEANQHLNDLLVRLGREKVNSVETPVP